MLASMVCATLATLHSAADLGMLLCLGGALRYGFSGLWRRRRFNWVPPLTAAPVRRSRRIGRAVSERFLARHGRWIGYSPQRKAAMQSLMQRWGGITMIISRTLTSSLSSVVSLFAGISRYRLSHFLGFALLGRVVWTSAYLGLGYAIGSNIEAASQFLGNLSGLLAALAVLTVASIYRFGLMGRAPA